MVIYLLLHILIFEKWAHFDVLFFKAFSKFEKFQFGQGLVLQTLIQKSRNFKIFNS
jgi:hypothetical protein